MTIGRWPGRGGLNSELGFISKLEDLVRGTGPQAKVGGPVSTPVSARETIRSGSKNTVITLENISSECG